MPDVRLKNTLKNIVKPSNNLVFNIGDYFRMYRSKYYVYILEIIPNQRNYEDGYGEYITTLMRVNIYDKEENLLADNVIVPVDNIINGKLSYYIPRIREYGPTYLGYTMTDKHPNEFRLWLDIIKRVFDYNDSLFPYIGALGTRVCDRWRCFEYFYADLRHMEGYDEYLNKGNNIYIVDLYDTQRHIHPANRIYAPGVVKLKLFKNSDICKYINNSICYSKFPVDFDLTQIYKSNDIRYKLDICNRYTGTDIDLSDKNTFYYVPGGKYNSPNSIYSDRYTGHLVNMCEVIQHV